MQQCGKTFFEVGLLPSLLREPHAARYLTEIPVTRLGSKKRPVTVRVESEDRAYEIMATCTANGWEMIVGVEPDQPEDITDLMKLLHPERFTVRAEPTQGRNDQCPCGSGRKYKKCCLRTATTP